MDKSKRGKKEEEEHIDRELVLSIEKLQEIQDELEKVCNQLPITKKKMLFKFISLINTSFCQYFIEKLQEIQEELEKL